MRQSKRKKSLVLKICFYRWNDFESIAGDDENHMRILSVILGVLLWVFIPVAFVIGILFGLFAGGIGGGLLCALGVPLVLFLLGLAMIVSGLRH